MLTEGQRKANFEEYEAKKHEYAEKITTLKQSIKELYVEYANTQNVIMKFDDRSWNRDFSKYRPPDENLISLPLLYY